MTNELKRLFVTLSDKTLDEKIAVLNAYAEQIGYGSPVIRKVNTVKSECLDILYLDNEFLDNTHDLYTSDMIDDILYTFFESLGDNFHDLEDLING